MEANIYNSYFTKNIFKYLLLFIFLFFFIKFIYLSYSAISIGFLPYLSDEYSYFLNTKSFVETNSLGAAVTLNERFSKIGDFSFHGPMYSLFYGLIYKIFNVDSILFINILLTFFLISFIFLTKIKLHNKLLFLSIYLSFFVVILYNFSYMTEIFHLFFVVIVSYLLYKIYVLERNNENLGNIYRYIFIFVLFIFLLSTFRQSWIFFLLALTPLWFNRKSILFLILLLFLGALFVCIDILFFHASYPFGFLSDLINNFSFEKIYTNFLNNVDRYFVSVTYSNLKFIFYFKYLFIFILLVCFYYGFYKKNKFLLSIAIVSFVNLIILFLFYDAYSWREVRTLSYIFILMVFGLILEKKYLFVYIVLIFQILSYSATIDFLKNYNNKRSSMINTKGKYKDDFNMALESIPNNHNTKRGG